MLARRACGTCTDQRGLQHLLQCFTFHIHAQYHRKLLYICLTPQRSNTVHGEEGWSSQAVDREGFRGEELPAYEGRPHLLPNSPPAACRGSKATTLGNSLPARVKCYPCSVIVCHRGSKATLRHNPVTRVSDVIGGRLYLI